MAVNAHDLPDGPVDRCVCAHVDFAEFKRQADRLGLDLEELCRRTGCGLGCGCCRPYLRVVLATGRTRLPVLTPEQFAAMGA
jgi:bacterioferritin-associated ferredoxin